MTRILLKDAQIGMVIIDDVVNTQQMLLLKKGVELSVKNLRMLKSWGVESVCVHQPGDDNEMETDSDNSQAVEQGILERFGDTIENPVMSEICRVAACILRERNQPV